MNFTDCNKKIGSRKIEYIVIGCKTNHDRQVAFSTHSNIFLAVAKIRWILNRKYPQGFFWIQEI